MNNVNIGCFGFIIFALLLILFFKLFIYFLPVILIVVGVSYLFRLLFKPRQKEEPQVRTENDSNPESDKEDLKGSAIDVEFENLKEDE